MRKNNDFLDCKRCKIKNADIHPGYTLSKATITRYDVTIDNDDDLSSYYGAYAPGRQKTELTITYRLNSFDDFEFYCSDCFDYILDNPKVKK